MPPPVSIAGWLFSGQALLDVEVAVAAGTKAGHRVAGNRKTPCGRQRRVESEILIVVARTEAILPVTILNAADTVVIPTLMTMKKAEEPIEVLVGYWVLKITSDYDVHRVVSMMKPFRLIVVHIVCQHMALRTPLPPLQAGHAKRICLVQVLVAHTGNTVAPNSTPRRHGMVRVLSKYVMSL